MQFSLAESSYLHINDVYSDMLNWCCAWLSNIKRLLYNNGQRPDQSWHL